MYIGRFGVSNSKVRPLPALIGAEGVRRLLELDDGFPVEQLGALLVHCGVAPVGHDADSNPLWADRSVFEQREAILIAYRRRMIGVDIEVLADVIREVMTASADVSLQRALDRNLSGALDDMDGRLDKLQESAQGLFRQQGANGQTLREVAQLCSTVVGEIRAGNAAVKKDVAAALAKFERHTEALMTSVAAEMQGVRLTLNELSKRVR
jgi:hypothetical protein